MLARSRWIHIGCVGLGILAVVPAVYAADSGQPSTPSQNQTSTQQLQGVEVISTAPLPGLGSPLNQVPSNVQTANSKDMQKQQSLNLTDYLNDNFSGVNVNASASNPYQPDVNYHGFTASPLLGTPEGLSVYVDGVRVNESFGDTVNWDLIPQSAISSISLIPGSNPVFGLNTLGGALSIQTKSGLTDPGNELQASGGSFGRRDFQAQTGGTLGHFDYFVTGNLFDQDGWRAFSPSHVHQVFGKVGWQNDDTRIDLSYTGADNVLEGNGAEPETVLAQDYSASYTPDSTNNHMNFLNLTGTHAFNNDLLLSGNVFYRQLETRILNGNTNDNYLDTANYALTPGAPMPPDCANPPPGNTTAGQAVSAFCANGNNVPSSTNQRTIGAGLQLTDSQDVFGLKNQAIIGASFARSRDMFEETAQNGTLNALHTIIPGPNDLPLTAVALNGTTQIEGLYVTDTLSPNSLLHLVASARYNRNTETLDGNSVNTSLGPTFLTAYDVSGDHSFHRINPALGFTITPSRALTFYADYNEGSRAPTVLELGCSNPDVPCGLPNAFASDPALQQVVARTIEGGARGTFYGKWLNWSVDAYRTRSANDIQFISTTTGLGYFDNVGDTRRQGFDLALGGTADRLTWHLVYSLVDATYQSSFLVSGSSNSSSDADGNITVQPGDRIPLIPRSTGRLILSYAVTNKWDVGAIVIVSAGSFLRGNENNANQAGGTTGSGDPVIGSGRIGGYTVVNLNTDYRIGKHVDLFARIDNVLDKKYATAGFLSTNSFYPNNTFRTDGSTTNENVVSPAAPRAAWVGVRVYW